MVMIETLDLCGPSYIILVTISLYTATEYDLKPLEAMLF